MLLDSLQTAETVAHEGGYVPALLESWQRHVGYDHAVYFAARIIDQPPRFYLADSSVESRVMRFIRNFDAFSGTPTRAARLASARLVVTDDDVYRGLNRNSDPFHNEVLAPLRTRGVACLVLGFRGKTFGFASLQRTSRGFTASEVALLRHGAIAGGLALAALSREAQSRGEDSCAAPFDGRLSERELAVARLAGTGLTNKEIATRLGTSQYTVRNQLQTIYRKLSIERRAELAAALHGTALR